MKRYDSRTADKFVVRLPDDMRADVEALAVFEDRSMNSVIVQAIRNHLDCNRRQELMLDALADALEQAVPGQERNNPGTDPRDLFINANPVDSFAKEPEAQP
ncbi:CopG family ribbon-helix-helix protein [Pseudomonas brassicacearum]|uniref:CopG family ribbon-helix-helix protein n=1 Tax=Pseudomonas brassicacearum TaxID=930166 RepID=UPI001BDE395A